MEGKIIPMAFGAAVGGLLCLWLFGVGGAIVGAILGMVVVEGIARAQRRAV